MALIRFLLFLCCVSVAWAQLAVSNPRFAAQLSAPDITAGLVARWPFNETSGTSAADTSGNGHTGTLTGGPTWTNAPSGRALSFDGVDNYVDTGSGYAVFQQTDPFSLCVWVQTSGDASLIAKWNVFVTGGWRMDLIGGKIRFLLQNATGAAGRAVASDAATYADGALHFVVATYSGNSAASGLKLYVDGGLVASTIAMDTDPGTLTDSPIYVGAVQLSTSSQALFLAGLLDDGRIYNLALSAGEVLFLYNWGPK